MHASALIAFRHLLVENAAAGSHPLHVACGHTAFVAERIAMRNFTSKDIGEV